jgi:hypothetical protein
MRKYLAAAAIGASLLASQAAAYDNDLVTVGDRMGSQASSSDNLESMGSNTWIFLTAVGVLIIAVAVIASNGHSTPTSP